MFGFYLRRVRRLLPAYLFDITGVVVVAQCLLARADMRVLMEDAWYALAFVGNFHEMLRSRTYAQMVSGYIIQEITASPYPIELKRQNSAHHSAFEVRISLPHMVARSRDSILPDCAVPHRISSANQAEI